MGVNAGDVHSHIPSVITKYPAKSATDAFCRIEAL